MMDKNKDKLLCPLPIYLGNELTAMLHSSMVMIRSPLYTGSPVFRAKVDAIRKALDELYALT